MGGAQSIQCWSSAGLLALVAYPISTSKDADLFAYQLAFSRVNISEIRTSWRSPSRAMRALRRSDSEVPHPPDSPPTHWPSRTRAAASVEEINLSEMAKRQSCPVSVFDSAIKRSPLALLVPKTESGSSATATSAPDHACERQRPPTT